MIIDFSFGLKVTAVGIKQDDVLIAFLGDKVHYDNISKIITILYKDTAVATIVCPPTLPRVNLNIPNSMFVQNMEILISPEGEQSLSSILIHLASKMRD